jgi:hypothetical protein
MKKVLLSLGILSCLTIDAQTLLSENFEGATFPPTGWSRSNTNAARAWDFTPVALGTAAPDFLITGTKSAGINYILGANTANLVSPSFSLVGANSPSLNFKVVVGYSYMILLNAGNLLAQISTDGGLTWIDLWNEDTETGFISDGDGNNNTDLYNLNIVSKTISLSSYIGQSNVKIRFQYVGDDADGVSIDDVQVLATTLSTDEVSKSKTNIYPNPTKGEVTIKTDKKIKSSTVVDLSGKVLLQTSSEKVDMSSFTKGTYLLKVEFADGSTKTEKIIKN